MDWRYNPNLLLYLPLHQLDGATFASKDAYGHLATVTAAVWTPRGRSFDGSNTYISIPEGAWIQNATRVSTIAWAKTASSITSARLVVSRELAGVSGGFALGAGWTTNRFTYYLRAASSWSPVTGSTAIVLDTWYCVAGVYDGANLNLYVNGILDATPEAKTGNNGGSGQNVVIGAKSDDLTGGWDGVIGEAWIFSHPPGALEVRRIFEQTKWRYM